MTGPQLRHARTVGGWTQAKLAKHLGVSQTYVCLLEQGERPVPAALAATLAHLLEMPASALPPSTDNDAYDTNLAARALAALGYDRFRDRPRRRERRNPAEVVLRCLRAADVDARVVEALVWVLVTHADLDWTWLVRHAKVADLQNRLGFLVSLAAQVAQRRGLTSASATLTAVLATLERSRLAGEGAFRTTLTEAERRWLRTHRPHLAAHWNLLTSLGLDDISDAA